MSQRAAWQLERLGIPEVYDFVAGKAHWLATGRPTIRSTHVDRVGDHVDTTIALIDIHAATGDARMAIEGHQLAVVVNSSGVVLGTVRSRDLEGGSSEDPIVDVMRLGPTTIRPDEPTSAIRERMARRNVTSLIVTAPTGVLLGLFHSP